MPNATIHLEGHTIAQTMCGRPTASVMWLSLAHNPDDLNAITCKRCLALHAKHAATHQAPQATTEGPSCESRSAGGFWCAEPAGADHYRDSSGTEQHQAKTPEGRTVNWRTPKSKPAAPPYAVLVDQACRVRDAALSPLDRLDALTDVIEQAEKLRPLLVAQAREAGASWEKIGQRLGITKQGARQNYGPKATPAPAQPGPDLLDAIEAAQ